MNGYGRIPKSFIGTTGSAHRHIYQELVGPIEKGLVCDHKCLNPTCVNPAHIEPVQQGENVRRSWVYGPSNPAMKQFPLILAPEQHAKIKANAEAAGVSIHEWLLRRGLNEPIKKK
jgi:hypothetical protein